MPEPRVSTLELLRRVRDEATLARLPKKKGYYDHQYIVAPELVDDIRDCITQAEQSGLTPEMVTQALQQKDALFSAIQGITRLEPVRVTYQRDGTLECAYCPARSNRQPLGHRAGCAWAVLKQVWDNYPGNLNLKSAEPT